MVTDYEAAWIRLQEVVASKTQHGREGLLVEMANIAADCRVPAGELSKLLRLYGVEVERVREASAEPDRAEAPDLPSGPRSLGDDDLAGHHDRGGHDGRRYAGAGAGAS